MSSSDLISPYTDDKQLSVKVESYAFCETKIHAYNDCENAKLFIELTGRGYLIHSDLKLISDLGYKIEAIAISQHEGVPEDELIPQYVQKQPWISVEEQPVPKDRKVLALDKDNDQAVVWMVNSYDKGDHFIKAEGVCGRAGYQTVFANITHWMDLPK